MRGFQLVVGGGMLALALACGGSTPEALDTGVATPAATVRPAAPRPAARPAPAAPVPEGKTVVDVGHGGLSITTKKGTEIDLQNRPFGGGLSIQGAKTDLGVGRQQAAAVLAGADVDSTFVDHAAVALDAQVVAA